MIPIFFIHQYSSLLQHPRLPFLSSPSSSIISSPFQLHDLPLLIPSLSYLFSIIILFSLFQHPHLPFPFPSLSFPSLNSSFIIFLSSFPLYHSLFSTIIPLPSYPSILISRCASLASPSSRMGVAEGHARTLFSPFHEATQTAESHHAAVLHTISILTPRCSEFNASSPLSLYPSLVLLFPLLCFPLTFLASCLECYVPSLSTPSLALVCPILSFLFNVSSYW